MDTETETLPVVKQNIQHFWNSGNQKYDVIDLNTGKMLVPVEREVSVNVYSLQLADDICDNIISGKTLKETLTLPNMPSITRFYAWCSIYPELAKRYEVARKFRADAYHDKALEIALSLPEKDMVPACKLAVDTLKWAAEKASPDYYGKPEKILQGTSINVTLHTGVLDVKAPTDIIIDEFGNFRGFDDGKTIRLASEQGDGDIDNVADRTLDTQRWGTNDRETEEEIRED